MTTFTFLSSVMRMPGVAVVAVAIVIGCLRVIDDVVDDWGRSSSGRDAINSQH